MGIIRRKWRQYCGILQPSVIPGARRHLFIPSAPGIPRIRIETRQSIDALARSRILVQLDHWPEDSRYPLVRAPLISHHFRLECACTVLGCCEQGHFVRTLGPLGDKATENEVLLIEHDVPHNEFSPAVLACLPKLPWTISEKVPHTHAE